MVFQLASEVARDDSGSLLGPSLFVLCTFHGEPPQEIQLFYRHFTILG